MFRHVALILLTRLLTVSAFTPSQHRIQAVHCSTKLLGRKLESDGIEPSPPKPESSEAFPRLYGGDFAGLSATFSASSGSIIPVPDYLVPESLLEWGQVPVFFEVITSEELKPEGDMFSLLRQTVSVLPEVGCGVDNLETIKVKESAELGVTENGADDGRITIFGDGVVQLEYPLLPLKDLPRKRIETTFGLEGLQRIRIMLDLMYSEETYRIQSPITIVLERQTSRVSSEGTIADGGGLDALTVSRLIGTDIQKSQFPEEELKGSEALSESWKRDKDGVTDKPSLLESATEVLLLPGNITLVYTTESPFALDVLHVSEDGNTKRVVRRRYDSAGRLADDASCWLEKKEM